MPDHQEEDDGEALAPLTCEAVLSPPLVHIGDEPHCLSYSNQQPAWHCSFSPDGSYLAVAYGAPDPCLRLWKLCGESSSPSTTATWKLAATLSGIQTRTIRSVAFAPVVRPLTLASASFDGTVTVWMHQAKDNDWDCIAQLEGHENEVKCVAWNAGASLLATSGRDKTVWIWECFLPGTVGGPGISDDQADGDFECIAVLHGHEADVKCVKFAPSHGLWGDGDDIALSASYDNAVRVWAEDAGDWFCAAVVDAVHSSTIWTLTVAPSGARFVSGSADGSLAIYKCYSAEELKKQSQANNEQEEQQPGSTRSAWKCVGKLPGAHTDTVYSVDYAPAKVGHGRIASGGADNRVQIYREALESTSEKPSFLLDAAATVQGGDINCVCWHPWNGSLLVSAGDDGNVRIWRYNA